MIDSINLSMPRRLAPFRKLWIYLLFIVIAAALFSFRFTLSTERVKAATYPPLTVVSAASYSEEALAPDAIAAAFGDNLSTNTVAASDVDPNIPGMQLPTTLGGTTVRVDGVPAQLLFVSKRQINFIIPSEIKPADSYGRSIILEVLSDGKEVTRQVIGVYKTAPAIFTHDSSGRGFPAAVLVRARANGDQIYESLMQRDERTGELSMRPIDLSDESERVFIALFLSGVRRASDPNNDGNLNEMIRVEINGFEFTPSYAGVQSEFPGTEQVNIELPRQLIGNPILTLRVISNDTGLSYNPGLLNYTKGGGIASNPTELYLKLPALDKADWRPSGLNGLDVHAFLNAEAYTFAATSEGIYNSLDDGESWSKATHSMPPIYGTIPRMYSLLKIPGQSYYTYMAGSSSITFVSGYIPAPGSPVFIPGDGVDWGSEPSYGLSDGTLSVPPKNTLALTLSPSSKYVLAGTNGGGIMRRESMRTNALDVKLWSSVNAGLTNMKVSSLATGAGSVFAGTLGAGVLVSNNEGDSWTALGGGLPSDLQVFALSVSGHAVFAGTDQGVWRSVDDGKNWSQVNQGLPAGMQVNAILAYGENVFAGAVGGGVFISNDAGQSWRSFNDGLTNKDILSLSTNNGRLYAGLKGGGLFFTPLFYDSNRPPTADSQEIEIDEGATKPITLTGADPDGDLITYSVTRRPQAGFLRGAPPNLEYTASQYAENDSFAFRTSDGKQRSQNATVNIKIKVKPSPTPTPPVEPPLGLTIEGTSTIQFAGARVKLYVQGSSKNVKVTAISIPSGARFSYFSYTGDDNSMSSAIVEWIPATSGAFNFSFAATNSGGDKVTKDFLVTVTGDPEKGVWAQINLPENRQIIRALVDGPTIYVATKAIDAVFFDSFDALFRSTDNGRSWTRIGKGLPTNDTILGAPILGFLIDSGKALYATLGGGLYRSTDAGEHWTNIGAGKGLPGDGKAIFNLDASGDKVLAGSFEKIFLSPDGGETWKEITNDLPVKPINNRVQALGVCGDVLLASLSLPILGSGPIAFRSTNNGANWLPSEWLTTNTMARFLVSEDGLYGMTWLGFFHSPDQGVNWQGLNPFFSPSRPEIKANTSVAAGSGILLIVYQDAGIHISRDRGQNWYPINQGLSEFSSNGSYMVAINNTHLFVVAGGKLLSRPH